MSFDNTRLSDEVEKGASGGPRYKTSIVSLANGYEQRNIDWSRSRGRWQVGYGVRSKALQEEVIAFFYARRGRARGFRFKDWSDYQIGRSNLPQSIGTGDGIKKRFQAVRTYGDDVESYDREITRLVDGTITVYQDTSIVDPGELVLSEGVLVPPYTLDINTGVLEFVFAPLADVIIGLVAEFDVPVRFDTDELEIESLRDDVNRVPDISIVELRERLQPL